MRRKDREVSALDEKLAILDKCEVCRVAFSVDDQPYIVPLNFGYEMQGEALVIYLHGAKKGKKADMLKQNPKVCFEMDTEHGVIKAEQPHNYSYSYASIIGFGLAELIEDTEQKIHGLKMLMQKVDPGREFKFDVAPLAQTMVFKIICNEFTGKRRPKP